MGYDISAKVGYGYIITDDMIPYLDSDEEDEAEKWKLYDEWNERLHWSDYLNYFDSYVEDCYFFGIILQDTEFYEPLDKEGIDKWDFEEWQKCEKEFHDLFPDSTQKPNTYLFRQFYH